MIFYSSEVSQSPIEVFFIGKFVDEHIIANNCHLSLKFFIKFFSVCQKISLSNHGLGMYLVYSSEVIFLSISFIRKIILL